MNVRVVGVIDLRAGEAVHARGGHRDRYAPVGSVAGMPIRNGDPVAVAHAYLALGVEELYVADLDAIAGGDVQAAALSALVNIATPVWIDAGITAVARAREVDALGAARLVVGLETLQSYARLTEITTAVSGDRVAFSLDIRDGRPLAASEQLRASDPSIIAATAAAAGAATVIVLDLSRVGAGAGPDVDAVEAVGTAVPHVTLVAGGGVRDASDLARLEAAGADAALVATALHDGRLTAADVARAHRRATR